MIFNRCLFQAKQRGGSRAHRQCPTLLVTSMLLLGQCCPALIADIDVLLERLVPAGLAMDGTLAMGPVAV